MKARAAFPVCVLLVLLAGGCGAVPFAREVKVPAGDLTPRELAERVWTAREGRYRMRYTVELKYHRYRSVVEGLMLLDTGERRARFVAMDVMGIKVLDVSTTPGEVIEHFAVPGLKGKFDIAARIGTCLERTFVGGQPGREDAFHKEEYAFRLEKEEDGAAVRFLFSGRGEMIEKMTVKNDGDWRVRYYLYGMIGDVPVPGGIVCDNGAGGLRLTFWMEEGKVIDE